MKPFFKTIAVSFCSLFAVTFSAQNQDDALRYSRFSLDGTARFNALGGAFTALGGDLSAVHTNPASVAVFRKSSFAFSPYVSVLETSTSHLNNTNLDYRTSFKFSNIGFVIANASRSESSKWRNTNFSVTFNKLADFNKRMFVLGTNNSSSLLDQFRDDIAQYGTGSLDPYSDGLAWDAYLIDSINIGGQTEFFTQIPSYGQAQSYTLESRGDMREATFTYGANYDDQLYVAGSISAISATYELDAVYGEIVGANDSTTELKDFQIRDIINSDGAGVRFSFGIIYRPHKYLRLGASAQSAARVGFQENYNASIVANYENTSFDIDNNPGFFDYSIKTPARYNLGAAYIFKKYGLLSIDYQIVDYSHMHMRSTPSSVYAFSAENDAIQTIYKQAHNLRIGAEARIKPFSVRTGYALEGNTNNDGFADNAQSTYSFGLGYAKKHFFFDVTGQSRRQNTQIYLYDPAYVQATDVSTNRFMVSTTIGFRF